jgi:hypothetical protein
LNPHRLGKKNEVDRKADHRIAKAHEPGIAWRLGIEQTGKRLPRKWTDWQANATGTEADDAEAEQARFVLRHGTGNPFGRNR